jgi:hypothetical protein
MVYEPFAPLKQAEYGGELLAHYQVPLMDSNDNWFKQVWNEKRLHWKGGQLAEGWAFASDWKPAPDAGEELGGWEPVFHSALTDAGIQVPGAGGTVFLLARDSGQKIARLNPFGVVIDPNTFVSGPITADSQGNIYYNVLKVKITNDPFTNDPWSFGPPTLTITVP